MPKSNQMPRRRVHVGDDVAPLEQRENRAHRRHRLTDVDHDRQIERRGRLLGATQTLEIVGAGDIFRQPRLDANDDVAVARNGAADQGYVGAVDVQQLPAGEAGARRNVDQGAADLRRAARILGDRVHVVRPARAGIDPSGHPILQAQRWPILAAAGMGVDVDKARGDDLASCVDRLSHLAGDVGLDRRNPAA